MTDNITLPSSMEDMFNITHKELLMMEEYAPKSYIKHVVHYTVRYIKDSPITLTEIYNSIVENDNTIKRHTYSYNKYYRGLSTGSIGARLMFLTLQTLKDKLALAPDPKELNKLVNVIKKSGKVETVSEFQKALLGNNTSEEVVSEIVENSLAEDVSVNEDKIIGSVYETIDYDKFIMLDSNRELNIINVNRLLKSFSDTYLFNPIIVNTNYEIIDGQHRFTAAKQLELPIRYVISDGSLNIKDISILNSNSKNWNRKDFLNSYVKQGVKGYILVDKFISMYPKLTISTAEILLTGKLTHSTRKQSTDYKSPTNKQGVYADKQFQEGKFEVVDFDRACRWADMVTEVKPYFESYNNRSFITALVGIIINHPDVFTFSKFIHKLETDSYRLHKCRTVTDYKKLIEDIYNYRRRTKVSLMYYK